MSSEFYLKAQSLYEEFQKKELHYLNAEKKLNDSLMWKKDLNMPLQEHLQKIHQREKQNEETYRSIMKQMNELDQQTDLLFSKIEKLGIFKNIQIGHNLNGTNYPLTSRYLPESLNSVQVFNTEPNVSHFKSNHLKVPILQCASTQTENNVYCDKCRSQIQMSCHLSQMQNLTSSTIDILSVSKEEAQIKDLSKLQDDSFSLENSSSSIIDILSVSKEEPQIIDSSKLQNNCFSLLNENDNHPQLITSSLNAEHFPSQIHENRKHTEKVFESGLQTNNKYDTKLSGASAMLEEKHLSLPSNEILVAENTAKDSEHKGPQSKSIDLENNVDVSVSKKDSDSVNHEFDFLESDTVHLSSKIKPQNSSKANTVLPSDVDKNIDQVASLDMKLPNKSSGKFRNERVTFRSNKVQELSDNRSDTSGSVSGTHSPVVSLSDTDSINEKESVTASAAYQSLLGNTVIPSKINKQVSESDSEDEVEKTLAHTVQKPNMKAKSSTQSKKDKSTFQSVDSKLTVNQPKPVSMNKPQSKLSKSTKKVLGIDTSSSSEMEAAIKSPGNKKDEDSDEFDFYD